MAEAPRFTPEEIGPWSEIKLTIVRDYAATYSKILSAQAGLEHIYIDAFAGGGQHISRTTGEFIAGSPVKALWVTPPFVEYHFIDLESAKVAELRTIAGHREDVHVYEGDCNSVLLSSVFPRARYEDYRRALCLLDPYGLHLNWEVIAAAGKMRSIDMFLNFPIHDINRNVLRHEPETARPGDVERMNAFWGDESWRQSCYGRQGDLFSDDRPVKRSNSEIAGVFRKRLRRHAGFRYVPRPVAMRNTKGATVYYLFFASQKPVADEIITDIFSRYQARGED
jgi:three-Cys-motif partner protein